MPSSSHWILPPQVLLYILVCPKLKQFVRCVYNLILCKGWRIFSVLFLILTLGTARTYFPFWFHQQYGPTSLGYFIMQLPPLPEHTCMYSAHKRCWIFIIWTDHVRVCNCVKNFYSSFSLKVFPLELPILKLKCHIMSPTDSVVCFTVPLNYLPLSLYPWRDSFCCTLSCWAFIKYDK